MPLSAQQSLSSHHHHHPVTTSLPHDIAHLSHDEILQKIHGYASHIDTLLTHAAHPEKNLHRDAINRLLSSFQGMPNLKSELSNNPPVTYVGTDGVDRHIGLTDDEKVAALELSEKFPLKISDYYLSLIKDQNPENPLRKIIIPTTQELLTFEDDDQVDVHLDESKYQPVPGIIHRYPGKLLFLPTLECLGHCRFCFRSERRCATNLTQTELDNAIKYISDNEEIRDVVFSGGDPMVMPIAQLEELIAKVRSIKHVEIIRITSRVASYAPHLIDSKMLTMLAKYRPIVFINSFMHPDEVVGETAKALDRMSKSGLILLEQGPILRGVNDSTDVLKKLYEKLIQHGVVPYYLNYGAMTKGTRHFTVHKDEVRSIVKSLENKTSGFCIPHMVTLDLNNDKTRSMN